LVIYLLGPKGYYEANMSEALSEALYRCIYAKRRLDFTASLNPAESLLIGFVRGLAHAIVSRSGPYCA